MASSRTHRSLIFWLFALYAGLAGAVAKADPLYNVTNLGSGSTVLTTSSGSATVAPAAIGWFPQASAMSQFLSVSNGQVSYSFATTPDAPLAQWQGPLASIPSGLGTSAAIYGAPEVSGFLNGNGFAAIVVIQPLSADPTFTYTTAYAVPQNSDGTLAWGQDASIASSPNNEYTTGGITIAGINSANQALLGTSFGTMPYDALVYNLGTNSLIDLDTLPAITAGGYSNLKPIAIDDRGQILVNATADTPSGPVFDTLLLTPGGTPPDPLATPEPGSCVIWAAIACASYVAVKRARVNG